MWLALWAQTPSAAPTEWVNFGTAGVVVVSFLLGWIWPRPAVDRIVKENERLTAENEQLRNQILTEVRGVRDELQTWRRRREAP